MKDKRDECGCHRDCIVYCQCNNPCEWPACLINEEMNQLEKEIIDATE